MIDIDELIGDCVAANAEAEPRLAMREVLARTLHDPGAVTAALPPTTGGITFLHHTSDLTVLHIVWPPHMVLYPHDHRMWACIGVHTGQEDNAFFRRPDTAGEALQDSGGKRLDAGDIVLLGDDTIHAVTNPAARPTGAIHVYGGDFVNQPRSQWVDPAVEQAHDPNQLQQQFAEANATWDAVR